MSEKNDDYILTDDPTWDAIEELKTAVDYIDEVGGYIYEIREETRNSNLKIMLKEMKSKLLLALNELNKIDEDTEIRMINNLKDVPGSDYESEQ